MSMTKRKYELELDEGDIATISDGLHLLYKKAKKDEEDVTCCWHPSDLYSEQIKKLSQVFRQLWLQATGLSDGGLQRPETD